MLTTVASTVWSLTSLLAASLSPEVRHDARQECLRSAEMTGAVPASAPSRHRAPLLRHCRPRPRGDSTRETVSLSAESAAFLLQRVAPQACNGKIHFNGRLISKHQHPEALRIPWEHHSPSAVPSHEHSFRN
ncbi:hypothetical protein BKA58DRAFT_4910 [Alternaria rosae]|uniref:uncharacterized protein n=1 Tax=Alternaria rosae TaxID=1187941 RepID=UPI001E8E52E8|nr:uncharacterized protein BKA58DRAFT_4910 [Alternaria rosae]KAH6881568.1 hypothetical protein BKA58DRAFT_4910 [Alternaria rosae]